MPPKPGDETEFGFGLAEAGGVRCEAEGAGEGKLTAAAEGEAVDAGDDGFWGGLDLGEDLMGTAGDAGELIGFG